MILNRPQQFEIYTIILISGISIVLCSTNFSAMQNNLQIKLNWSKHNLLGYDNKTDLAQH